MSGTINGKYMIALTERNTIIKTMIVGFVLGIVVCISFFFITKPEKLLDCVTMALLFGVALSGMPYVWTKLPKLYNIFSPVCWFLFIVKLAVAGYVGMVYTPIMLIVKSVQTIMYKKQMKNALDAYAMPYYAPAKN